MKYYAVALRSNQDTNEVRTMVCDEVEVNRLVNNIDRNYTILSIILQEDYDKDFKKYCKQDENIEKGEKS